MKIADDAQGSAKIIFVDLDDTLLSTDTAWESLVALLKTQPWLIPVLPVWLLKGKAYLKEQLARRITLNPATLPYRADVLEFLRGEKERGKEIVLATGADRKIASNIAQHLGFVSGVIASDGKTNLIGQQKLEAIRLYSGGREFDYIGNSSADLPIWHDSGRILIVNPPRRLEWEAHKIKPVTQLPSERSNPLMVYGRTLRINNWVKNTLLLVPLLTSHRITEPGLLLLTIFAFFSFSLCSSATYVVNDLLDLEADRKHPIKRFRPFAQGTLPIRTGLFLIIALLIGSLLLAALVGRQFLPMPLLYLILSSLYSFWFKRLPIIDVMLLGTLYSLRVFAGGIATGIRISEWLLVFSLFLFLSLAFVKRYGELVIMHSNGTQKAAGRGYLLSDLELVSTVGVTSGYLSVLVLALYISSSEVSALYRHHQVLWFACLPYLYWITRIWLLAHRGELKEDPLVFTLSDPASYAALAMIGLTTLAAL